MRSYNQLGQLQKSLKELPASVVDRVNKEGGLHLSSIFDLVAKPIDHAVNFYLGVPDESLSTHEKVACEDLSNVGVVLHVTCQAHLVRDDVKKFVDSCTFPVWFSCPQSFESSVSILYPKCNVLNQYEFVALTPDNLLVSNDEACLQTCGPGDAIAALVHDVAFKNSTVSDVYLIDLESARCYIDEVLLSQHRSGSNVTASVMPDAPGDCGAVLCVVDGCPQLLERFLFMNSPDLFDYTHTGHLIFRANLALDKIRWAWHRRKVAVDGKVQVQHKRYLYNITEAYDTKFVKVPRELHVLT